MILDPQHRTAEMLPVQVTATSPLTVSFPDGSTHPALGASGSTFSTSSGVYVAFFQQGSMPVVISIG